MVLKNWRIGRGHVWPWPSKPRPFFWWIWLRVSSPGELLSICAGWATMQHQSVAFGLRINPPSGKKFHRSGDRLHAGKRVAGINLMGQRHRSSRSICRCSVRLWKAPCFLREYKCDVQTAFPGLLAMSPNRSILCTTPSTHSQRNIRAKFSEKSQIAEPR